MSPERPGRWVTLRPGAGEKMAGSTRLEEPLAGKASGAGFFGGRPSPILRSVPLSAQGAAGGSPGVGLSGRSGCPGGAGSRARAPGARGASRASISWTGRSARLPPRPRALRGPLRGACRARGVQPLGAPGRRGRGPGAGAEGGLD